MNSWQDVKKLNLTQDNIEVLCWIPGHSRTKGNVKGGSMAREGSQGDSTEPEPILNLLAETTKMS